MADKLVKGYLGREQPKQQYSTETRRSNQISREEKLLKERLLDEKMKLMRQKNEERLRRRKEIDEDIKNANLHNHPTEEKQEHVQPELKMAGVKTESRSVTKIRGRARGKILEKMAKEELQAHKFTNRRKQNIEQVEKEIQEEKKKATPPCSTSSFLADDRRADMSKVVSRSNHCWGGSQFEDVVSKIGKERSRPQPKEQPIEICMTGRERIAYSNWKDERLSIDKERKLRQHNGNSWQREWDQCKEDDQPFPEKQTANNSRHNGQGFGDKTRHTPDFNHHDDRAVDTEEPSQQRSEKQKQESKSTSEDSCEDSSNAKENIDIRIDQEEDWEKSISANDMATTESTTESTTEEITNVKPAETPEDSLSTADKQGNILVIDMDSNVKVDVTTMVVDPEIEEIPAYPERVIDDMEEEASKTSEVSAEKPEGELAEPVEHQTPDDGKDGNATESQVMKNGTTNEQPLGDNSNDIEDRTAIDNKHAKPQESLPNLDLSKAEDQEPIPDFLKTPESKNWADYEFDEDELELNPLIISW